MVPDRMPEHMDEFNLDFRKCRDVIPLLFKSTKIVSASLSGSLCHETITDLPSVAVAHMTVAVHNTDFSRDLHVVQNMGFYQLRLRSIFSLTILYIILL